MTTIPASEQTPPLVTDELNTPLRARIVKRLRNKPTALGAGIALGIIVLLALVAPLIAPQNPYDISSFSITDNLLNPGGSALDGRIFYLGTDEQGRDMLSAILYGLRISLIVGVVATTVSILIGIVVGLVAGYVGGWVETLLMRIVDFVLGFPTLLVAMVLLALLGKGVDKVIITIIAVQWARSARIVRASVLVERRKEYVEAAKNLGIPGWRIMFVETLPNCLPPLLVVATVLIASAITLEATLSFLGVGVPITEPSLGALISKGGDHLLSGEYWISLFPGLALLILIFSINIVGDRLRESIDPRRQ